jgi:soluble cytochrome b562
MIKQIASLARLALVSSASLCLVVNSHAELNTPLSKEMKTMGRNYKQLKGQIADASKKDSTLAMLGEMVKAAEKARTLDPKKTEEIPADKRGQFLADYQKAIDELIAGIHKVEAAIAAGNTKEAATLFASLNNMKRHGHERFSSEEKEAPKH